MNILRRLGRGTRPNNSWFAALRWASLCSTRATALALALLICATAPVQLRAQAQTLPPPIGPETPRVEPGRGDDGIYHQKWAAPTFLDMRDDYAEAETKGKRFAVVFEQRGCIYCTKMHTEVLALKYINDYVRENFHIVQIDLWGSREATDFDGAKMSEKKLAERWGVMFTPTVVFFKDGLKDIKTYGQPLEVTRMSLGFGPGTFYDLFVWVRAKVYEQDRNFQRFHLARHTEREALKKK
jgi:thioredoxin-related protein